jgi:hypothetical protein
MISSEPGCGARSFAYLWISRPIVYNGFNELHFCRMPVMLLRKVSTIDFAKLTEEALMIADPSTNVAQASTTSATSATSGCLCR